MKHQLYLNCLGGIKKRYNQFKCLHFWIKGLPVDLEYGKGYKYVFECDVCHKRIERWSGYEPISGILNDPMFERKDPRYHTSPPILYIDRSKF